MYCSDFSTIMKSPISTDRHHSLYCIISQQSTLFPALSSFTFPCRRCVCDKIQINCTHTGDVSGKCGFCCWQLCNYRCTQCAQHHCRRMYVIVSAAAQGFNLRWGVVGRCSCAVMQSQSREMKAQRVSSRYCSRDCSYSALTDSHSWQVAHTCFLV
jgi:hypothetical protein